MTQRRRSRALLDPAPSTAPTADSTQSTAGVAEFALDRQIVDAVNKDIWAALFDGDFRLGVKCERCGRWLYQGRSKKRRLGDRCHQLAAAEAVAPGVTGRRNPTTSSRPEDVVRSVKLAAVEAVTHD